MGNRGLRSNGCGANGAAVCVIIVRMRACAYGPGQSLGAGDRASGGLLLTSRAWLTAGSALLWLAGPRLRWDILRCRGRIAWRGGSLGAGMEPPAGSCSPAIRAARPPDPLSRCPPGSTGHPPQGQAASPAFGPLRGAARAACSGARKRLRRSGSSGAICAFLGGGLALERARLAPRRVGRRSGKGGTRRAAAVNKVRPRTSRPHLRLFSGWRLRSRTVPLRRCPGAAPLILGLGPLAVGPPILCLAVASPLAPWVYEARLGTVVGSSPVATGLAGQLHPGPRLFRGPLPPRKRRNRNPRASWRTVRHASLWPERHLKCRSSLGGGDNFFRCAVLGATPAGAAGGGRRGGREAPPHRPRAARGRRAGTPRRRR